MSEQKTIRIRVAVAVMENGDYQASGWKINGKESTQARDTARECAEAYVSGSSAQIRWVEADVPAYVELPTVEGTVVPE